MKSKNLHVVQERSVDGQGPNAGRAHWPRRWLWWTAPVAWAGLLFVASSFPGRAYPEVTFAAADKLVHLGIYGVLGALLARAAWSNLRGTTGRQWAWSTGIATLYGATDELHQLFVPNRSADVRDLLADALGAALGAAAVLAFTRWRAKQNTPAADQATPRANKPEQRV